ncbi:MAG TPA: hypothetical protein VKK81_29330 [Candidatus Binatia bacterium]|nr:hypothetical protein [Candidatus Binatia bacterium]
MVDGQIRYVARSAADLVEYEAALCGGVAPLGMSWLEVVEQVEFQVIGDRGIDLVSVLAIGGGWRSDLVL